MIDGFLKTTAMYLPPSATNRTSRKLMDWLTLSAIVKFNQELFQKASTKTSSCYSESVTRKQSFTYRKKYFCIKFRFVSKNYIFKCTHIKISERYTKWRVHSHFIILEINISINMFERAMACTTEEKSSSTSGLNDF